MANENLTAALRGTLHLVENSPTDSPLREPTTDSVDILLDELTQHIANGMPEAITDEKLSRLADIYRAEGYRWEQEEQKKATETRAKRKPSGLVVDIDLLSEDG